MALVIVSASGDTDWLLLFELTTVPLVELTSVLVEVWALLSDVPDDEFNVFELEEDPVEGFVTEMELLVC